MIFDPIQREVRTRHQNSPFIGLGADGVRLAPSSPKPSTMLVPSGLRRDPAGLPGARAILPLSMPLSEFQVPPRAQADVCRPHLSSDQRDRENHRRRGRYGLINTSAHLRDVARRTGRPRRGCACRVAFLPLEGKGRLAGPPGIRRGRRKSALPASSQAWEWSKCWIHPLIPG